MSNVYTLKTQPRTSAPQSRAPRGEDQPRRTERLSAEELALISRELHSGSRSVLGVCEGLELIEEVRWLRHQLQRIRCVSDPARQQLIAHEALYGKRPPIMLLKTRASRD